MKVTKIEEFNSDISKVWDIVTDNYNYSWRSDIENIEVLDENRFIEKDKNGYEVNFEITLKKEYEIYKFDMISKNTKGSWTGKFEQLSNGGTRIEFIENVTTNNILMKLFLKRFLQNHQAKYISDLKVALGE